MKLRMALSLAVLASLTACASAGGGPEMPDYSGWHIATDTITSYAWRGKPATLGCVYYFKYNREQTERWIVLVVRRPDDASKVFFALYKHEYRADQGKTGEAYLFEPKGEKWKFAVDIGTLSNDDYAELIKGRYELEYIPPSPQVEQQK